MRGGEGGAGKTLVSVARAAAAGRGPEDALPVATEPAGLQLGPGRAGSQRPCDLEATSAAQRTSASHPRSEATVPSLRSRLRWAARKREKGEDHISPKRVVKHYLQLDFLLLSFSSKPISQLLAESAGKQDPKSFPGTSTELPQARWHQGGRRQLCPGLRVVVCCCFVPFGCWLFTGFFLFVVVEALA